MAPRYVERDVLEGHRAVGKDMGEPASDRGWRSPHGVNNLAWREFNGSPELLLYLALDAVPELFCALGRRPYPGAGIEVEMPSGRASGHPDLASRAMAVDHEALAIGKLERQDAALEIDLEPVDLIERHLERAQRALGQSRRKLFAERFVHGTHARKPRSSVPGRRTPDLTLQIARRAPAGTLGLGSRGRGSGGRRGGCAAGFGRRSRRPAGFAFFGGALAAALALAESAGRGSSAVAAAGGAGTGSTTGALAWARARRGRDSSFLPPESTTNPPRSTTTTPPPTMRDIDDFFVEPEVWVSCGASTVPKAAGNKNGVGTWRRSRFGGGGLLAMASAFKSMRPESSFLALPTEDDDDERDVDGPPAGEGAQGKEHRMLVARPCQTDRRPPERRGPRSKHRSPGRRRRTRRDPSTGSDLVATSSSAARLLKRSPRPRPVSRRAATRWSAAGRCGRIVRAPVRCSLGRCRGIAARRVERGDDFSDFGERRPIAHPLFPDVGLAGDHARVVGIDDLGQLHRPLIAFAYTHAPQFPRGRRRAICLPTASTRVDEDSRAALAAADLGHFSLNLVVCNRVLRLAGLAGDLHEFLALAGLSPALKRG